MNCKEIENKLIFYLDKELPTIEQNEISKHLEKCKSCSTKLALIKSSFNFIEKEKDEELNPFITTQIMARIEAETKKTKSVFIKILQPISIAALLILAILIGNFASKSYNSLETENLQTQNTNTIDNSEQFVINDISYEDYYFIASQ